MFIGFKLIFFIIFYIKIINKLFKLYIHGDWGLGIGDWGLGIGPNPQSPIPNPQSPIPINYINKKLIILLLKFILINFISLNEIII